MTSTRKRNLVSYLEVNSDGGESLPSLSAAVRDAWTCEAASAILLGDVDYSRAITTEEERPRRKRPRAQAHVDNEASADVKEPLADPLNDSLPAPTKESVSISPPKVATHFGRFLDLPNDVLCLIFAQVAPLTREFMSFSSWKKYELTLYIQFGQSRAPAKD